MEERQILRALLLMFLVFAVYYTVFQPQPRPKEMGPRATPTTAAEEAGGSQPRPAPATAQALATVVAPVARIAADVEYLSLIHI